SRLQGTKALLTSRLQLLNTHPDACVSHSLNCARAMARFWHFPGPWFQRLLSTIEGVRRKDVRPIVSPKRNKDQWKSWGMPPAEMLRKSRVNVRITITAPARIPSRFSKLQRITRPRLSRVR